MAPHDPTYFEQQRDALMQEIGASLEQVLQNVNKLNRSLEGATAVGSEFQSVEALWSNFEALMGKRPEDSHAEAKREGENSNDPTSPGQGQTQGRGQ